MSPRETAPSAVRHRQTGGRAVRAGLEHRQEAARGRRRTARPPDRRHGLEAPGQGRAAPGGEPRPGRAGRRTAAARRALPGRDALLHALLDGVLPAAGLEQGPDKDRLRAGGRAPPGGRPQERPRRHPGAAAHGQLGPGGCLGHHQARRPLHHRRRAPQARDALRPLRRLPRGPGHGGAAAHRRLGLRHPGPAAAGRRPGLPGRRPRSVRLRDRGQVLRRGDADAGRTRDARPADRRDAAAGHPLVRRHPRHARPGPPADRGARDRHPRREGRRR